MTDRSHPGGTWRDKTGTEYEADCDEPSAGQLVHLRHGLDADADDAGAEDLETIWFPPDEIAALAEAASDDHPDARARTLQPLISAHGPLDQMIMVADLALAPGEGPAMDAAHARDQVTATSSRRRFRDARPALRDLTGFRVMQAFCRDMPVIVTTYSSSPLVHQHCLVNGAFAVVEKPAPQKATNKFDMRTARNRAIHALELSARQNSKALDVVVAHYATLITSEVLKAISARVAHSSA